MISGAVIDVDSTAKFINLLAGPAFVRPFIVRAATIKPHSTIISACNIQLHHIALAILASLATTVAVAYLDAAILLPATTNHGTPIAFPLLYTGNVAVWAAAIQHPR